MSGIQDGIMADGPGYKKHCARISMNFHFSSSFAVRLDRRVTL